MNTELINRRLLVVDDQQVIYDAFRAVFAATQAVQSQLDDFEASLFGETTPVATAPITFDLDHAFQGKEGLEKVIESKQRQDPFAVAFVDMRMPPGWDGLDTIARLLETDEHLQIVMCTAYSDYTWNQVLDRLGFTDRLLLLRKPFATEEVFQLAIALTEKYRLSHATRRHLETIEQTNTQLRREIDERRKAQEQLTRAAMHDGLTNLPNRRQFVETLQQTITSNRSSRSTSDAVLFIDVDNFKTINDMLGHMVGDQFLRQVAQRLQTNYRSSDQQNVNFDLPARLAGDEFVILIRDLSSIDEAVAIAERLAAAMKEPFLVDGHQIGVTASVGIATVDDDAMSPDEVLRNADVAMYQAKTSGKDRVAIFDADMHAAAVRRVEIEAALHTAIERNEMRLDYQPIYATETQSLVGFEALLRWRNREKGEISPAEFIPIAEETPLMASIGEWVIEQACGQLHEWRTNLPESEQVRLSVNVSRRQLVRPEFVPNVERILAKYPDLGAVLNFEVTESAVMSDPNVVVHVLNQLRELGISIHMDDFGTGHSSLSCLHHFPIDVLKIDRSFVTTMESNPDYETVVHAIVTLAHHMGMAVVAEGVEMQVHFEALRNLGCDYVQGYYFSKSLPAEAATRWIIEEASSRSDATLSTV